jgi:hypothetical protein
MTPTLLTLALLAGAAGEPAAPTKGKPRPRSDIAPSLPQLTKAEEEKLDEIVDRFILADSGKLRGAAAKEAIKAFNALKPEAIPALIRGLNKAARIEHSCPVTTIAKKLERMLMASEDAKLLDYARDEIGADIGRTRHAAMVQGLRFRVTMRMNALARRPPPPPKAPRSMSTGELVKAVSTLRGPRLKAALTELEGRKGKEVLGGLSLAAGSYDRDTQKLGRALLDKHLGRLKADAVKARLTDELPEVRRAAIRAIAAKHSDLAGAIIDRVTDDNAGVRAEARQALVKLSGGTDHGPAPGATKAQREQAQRQWRAWWARRASER